MSNYDPYNEEEHRHLPHEAWHVVQEKSQRRRLTLKHESAEFIGYPSPSHDTNQRFPDWRIEVTQGNWQDEVTPTNNPLHSPNLSGEFKIRVFVRCKDGEYKLWKDNNGNSTSTVECTSQGSIMTVFVASSATGCEGEYTNHFISNAEVQ